MRDCRRAMNQLLGRRCDLSSWWTIIGYAVVIAAVVLFLFLALHFVVQVQSLLFYGDGMKIEPDVPKIEHTD